MSKTPTGITTGDVVAFLISPALLAAKWTAEGCEIAARERKARVRVPSSEGNIFVGTLVGAGSVLMCILSLCGII